MTLTLNMLSLENTTNQFSVDRVGRLLHLCGPCLTVFCMQNTLC